MTHEGTLQGKRIVLTRRREDAGDAWEALTRAGAAILELPTITIEPEQDIRPLDAALRRLENYDWIAFASRQAVKMVFDRVEALGMHRGPFHIPRVGAVGPSTAAELRARDVAVACVPDEATGRALAAAMVKMGVLGSRVLLPLGNLARPELGEDLEAAGARVERIVVYRTVTPAEVDQSALHALRAGQVDLVALASPSAMRNLVELLGPDADVLRAIPLACIGPSTAEAVRALGFEPAAVATEHTLSGLVTAISDTLVTEHTHERV
jgi:uroporphyrinogen III methyltransferase/synthase